MKTIRGLEHLSTMGTGLQELGLFSLGKGKLCEDLVVTSQYLKGAYKNARKGLFTKVYSGWMRWNGLKPEEDRLTTQGGW